MQAIDLSAFIEAQALPASYEFVAKRYFYQMAAAIKSHHTSAGKPVVIGINGSQGAGKSTLAALLCHLFNDYYQLNAISISLDDFYHTQAKRQALSQSIHPLLATRGVPGTHDIELAIKTVHALIAQETPVNVPRFDKANDDRAKKPDVVNSPVDIIILEGWCLGAPAEDESSLLIPVNALEEAEDPKGVWRQYANEQLATQYQDLFALVDIWAMLKAPSFDSVFNWRLEQEEKLKAKLGDAGKQSKIMDAAAIERFIQFYQRITEHGLATMPENMHYLFRLDEQREIKSMITKPTSLSQIEESEWLVFTDMDGSLLDHYTYDFEAAVPTLAQLKKHKIPVIPITSKTQAEVEDIRQQLNNRYPFIIENGAAVFIPKYYFRKQPEGTEQIGDYWVRRFVAPRADWQALIAQVRDAFKGEFVTFAEAGVEGIMEMTGLDAESASKAAQRQYGEPIAWKGTDERKLAFKAALQDLGAIILEGGRFMHVSGKSNKGMALHWLTSVYQQSSNENAGGKPYMTIALGDSQNDRAMLEVADYAITIRSPVHAPPTLDRLDNVILTKQYGPNGWVEGVNQIIGLHINN